MKYSLLLLSLLSLYSSKHRVAAQFSSQNYPDPRSEPLRCKLLLPGQVCDPSDVLNDEERRKLNEKVQQLQGVTAQIRNSVPACLNSPNQNLQIIVAVIEKIGANNMAPVNIEQFTNELRNKYLNYQDLSCDTLVLIVNSRRDRQVFTVAGRDAKLSKPILQTAFQRNIGYFRGGQYAMGVEGMVEYIVSSYSSIHIVQVPPPEAMGPTSSGVESITSPLSSSNFVAHGVRQKPEQRFDKFDLTAVNDDDRVWVELMIKAGGRCGFDPDKMTEHVRAVVEEAMNLSLKLISDPRYNKIEEFSQDVASGAGARERAWNEARSSFLDSLYHQYKDSFPRTASQCPDIQFSADPTPSPLSFPFGK